MSGSGMESIDSTVHLTHLWIKELDAELGWADKARSYRLLRVVLQSLRDWLQVNEAADLAAQLPALLRGVYYEHWRPAACPVRARSRDDFLARVDHAFRTDPIADTASAVSTVFGFLTAKIGPGEMNDVRQSLPADLRKLWPGPARAA